MANTISPNMNLIIPGVGTEAGPLYAQDINNSLAIIDAHTHTAGSGVLITTAALNINANLSMNINGLIGTSFVNFSALGLAPINQSLYTSGVDLYFIDGSGNQIRITSGGAVTGSTGTITGLPSGTASAAYATGTFTFQSATNTAANIDGGSFILRNSTANSFGVTLSPPNALAGNYTLVLPLVPAQTNVMTLDSSGNMSSVTWNTVIANTTIATGTSVGVGGFAISSSSGTFTTSSATPVPITNLSVTLVTNGKPVYMALNNDGSSPSYVGGPSSPGGSIVFYRDGTPIGYCYFSAATSTDSPVQGFSFFDVNALAGSHIYQAYAQGVVGGPITIEGCTLVAYEL